MKSLKKFQEYLEMQSLVALKTEETSSGFEAIVRKCDRPQLSCFSQMTKHSDHLIWLRLSFKDLNNEKITGGFFNEA